MRYIELNAVRAAMVERAVDHRWSSVRAQADGADDPLLTLHPLYLALGADSGERCAGYRAWLHATLDTDELARIRAYVQQERALGQPRFQAMVAKALNRTPQIRPRGRPRAAGLGIT